MLNAPLLVSDYKSLPNEKFQAVSTLLGNVHPDRRRYVKVVFNRINDCFEVVPVLKPVSNISYVDYVKSLRSVKVSHSPQTINHCPMRNLTLYRNCCVMCTQIGESMLMLFSTEPNIVLRLYRFQNQYPQFHLRITLRV